METYLSDINASCVGLLAGDWLHKTNVAVTATKDAFGRHWFEMSPECRKVFSKLANLSIMR